MELPVSYLQLGQSNFDKVIGTREDQILVKLMTEP